MEIEKEKNIHYLHPDFEEDNENQEKKPSPLELLAQTCQSICVGIKNCKSTSICEKSLSPNSTNTGTRRSFKRSNSDYLSNSSNSPSIDRTCSPPLKKIKQPTDLDYKSNSFEQAPATEISPDTGKEINHQSLMNSFTNFLINSNNFQQAYTDNLELLYFLTNRFTALESNLVSNTNISNNNNNNNNNNKQKEMPNFNISNGYHLKNSTVESTKLGDDNKSSTASLMKSTKNSEPNYFDQFNNAIDQTQKSTSAIKYCMYCGKLIPLLPMLLAHIRIDHCNDQFSDIRKPNINSTMPPPLMDFLTKLYPYNMINQNKSDPSLPVSSFTNYINNWPSLFGYENLIF